MASIFSVAKYIHSKLGDISAMKLQKLAYYSQAWTLVWDEKELFSEDFQAWANGPVCPELYSVHRGEFLITNTMFLGNIDDLTSDEKENIDKVLEHYGDKTAQWLSDLTHMEDPWINARQEAHVQDGERCDKIINKGEMHLYYSGL
jgi:uncharacterized phage-associated protein